MADSQIKSASKGATVPSRVVDWVDERTGIRSMTRMVLDEPIPGGARWAYVFGSGLLFIFLLQVITGVSLALYYTPTVETAHTSLAYITKQVAGGAFLRTEQPSAQRLDDELRVLHALSVAYPLVFLSVAAFMVNAVLARIVRLQREQAPDPFAHEGLILDEKDPDGVRSRISTL